jgi:hypothetical protein
MLGILFSKRPSLCETSLPAPQIKKEIYGVKSADQLFNSNLIAAVPRCMHDACWLSLARAYVLSIYLDESLSVSHWKDPKANKVFLFTFLQGKDRKHVMAGFRRSLEWAKVDSEVIDYFISILVGREIMKGDRLIVKITDKTVNVIYENSNQEILEEIEIDDSTGSLRNGFYSLFLTDQRYKRMFWDIQRQVSSQ